MGAVVKRRTFFRIGIAMAFLSVFAFVAPPVAMALAPAKDIISCLIEDDQEWAPEHYDDQGAEHADHKESGTVGNERHSHAHGHAGDGPDCCRIFCVTALAPETGLVVRPVLSGSEYNSAIDPSFHSRAPELPFRPPNSNLSS